MKTHAAADAFPLLDGDEFAALVEDIREHGQREPIVLCDGAILDGRNRYRACEQLGIVPKVIEWDGVGSPEAFVVSKNIMRRHLSAGQRAMIAAKFATFKRGRIDLQRKTSGHVNTSPRLSNTEAAQLAGVHPSQIIDARVILEAGTPEQIASAEAGEIGPRTLANQIRSGRSDEEEERRRLAGVEKRRKTRKGMTKLWLQFKDGIDKISSLPEANDVLNAIPPESWQTYGRRATAALRWLQQFEEGFNDSYRNKDRRGADQNGSNDRHAGDSDQAA